MNKFLGIDLGTTYSCVASIDETGKPVILKNAEGELTTASVVFFESSTNIAVGSVAKESAMLYPNEVVSYAKRSLGIPGVSWHIHGIDRTPEEVSSYILRKLVNDANAVLQSENKLAPGEEIKDVVITCPAYFGITEREATRAAGEIAGLTVLGIINEPTAAAITYGLTDATQDHQVIMVYDLGGGTFDVTIIDIQPDAIKVICTGGDQSLGGKLWDDRIINYIAAEFTRQTGNAQDILSDPETLQELTIAAERAKKMLSARERAPLAINYRGDRARVELTRVQFNAFTADLLERTISLTKQTMEEAVKKGYKPADINEILLVGGSTRMPQIQQRVQEAFGLPVKIYDPDEAVAKGAALYASRQAYYNRLFDRASKATGAPAETLQENLEVGQTSIEELVFHADMEGEPVPAMIINVTSRSFGTIAYENRENNERTEILYNMILRNTELPASNSRRFFTVVPNQRTVSIRVLESLSTSRHALPEEGTAVGETILELPKGLPAGSPLEIEFRLNESGLLELKATELLQGHDILARFETVNSNPSAARHLQETKRRVDDSLIL